METLSRAAQQTRHLIVVEDHWIDGGLGDAVAAAVGSQVEVHRLAVTKEPHSGAGSELPDRSGISSRAIQEVVLELAAA